MQPKYIELFYNDLVRVAMREIASGHYCEGHPVEVALQLLEEQAARHQRAFRTIDQSSYFHLIPMSHALLPRKREILVISREKGTHDLLFVILSHTGYSVSMTSDVADIVLLSHSRQVDLIIYDLDSISLECVDLCIADIPQLAMSSEKLAGLRKPFTQDELLCAVERIFRENGYADDMGQRRTVQHIDEESPAR